MKRLIYLLFILMFPEITQAQLKVALYPYLPRGDQFEKVLTSAWNQLGTNVQLQFVTYDCYQSDPPDSINVFVFDGIFLKYFQSKGYLKVIDTTQINSYNDFWPFTRQSVKINNDAYGVPYLSCANVYFYRKSDKSLNSGSDLNLSNFFKIIGPAQYTDTIPPVNKGLIMDYSGSTTDACIYVNGWMNYHNDFTTSPPLPPYTNLDKNVVENLRYYTKMAGVAQASYSDPGINRITWFAKGYGRSMIGITENSASLRHTFLDSIGFRMMPLADNLPAKQNFYVDMVGINSKVPKALQEYAVKLVNLMTSYDVMYNSMIPWQNNPNPQFLIPVRSNLLADLVKVHPLYNDILQLLKSHIPYPFLLPEDSRVWLKENKSGIRTALLIPIGETVSQEKIMKQVEKELQHKNRARVKSTINKNND